MAGKVLIELDLDIVQEAIKMELAPAVRELAHRNPGPPQTQGRNTFGRLLRGGRGMNEMVDRVARAICAEYGDVYDEQPADLPTLREWRKREGGSGSVDADGVGVVRAYDPGLPTQKDWQDMARAAIDAMREPTEAMVAAGEPIVYECYSLEPGEGLDENPAVPTWRAMISAALISERGAEE